MKKISILLLGMIAMMHAENWYNWAHNQSCNTHIFYPENVSQLESIIAQAKKMKKQIRAYGSSHSWSDIVCTNNYLINTDKLNKIIAIDAEKKQARVQAGIKLEDLNKELDKAGLALPNQGAITKQSLAGVVCTATHGSGKTGTYADFITEVKVFCADGIERTFSEKENADAWPAVRTNIGCLGIITEYTVQCVPQFYLIQEKIDSNWDQILKTYKKLLDQNDFMEFTVNASDDSVQVRVSNKVHKNDSQGSSFEILSGVLVQKYVEEEIAVPLDQFIPAAEAAHDFIKRAYKKNAQFNSILFRFVRKEKNNLLSSASNQDVCFFSITVSPRTDYEPFFKEYYKILTRFGGRPHWGKINYLTKADTQKLYGQNYNRFVEIRKKLDPDGLFSNSFTKRIFGW